MAGRQGRRAQRRPQRNPARRILVVTEGIRTEPQYVERLDGYLRSRSATAIVKSVGVGEDPLRVVEKSIELRDAAAGTEKRYDVCVCLVDVDEHTTLERASRLAEHESILLLVSNLKFEAWLRWHAEDKRSALSSSQLDQRMATLKLTTGKRLPLRFPIDGVDDACRVARAADPAMQAGRVGPDPSSAMPILVDLMRGES
ncbi:RloB family protein [Brevibacterium sp. CCUG 69071]|uniref:RloB family protein n=1 Tax=Brevibacterium sp. CCUG 69071 TaxID=2052937 RepID=UPI002E7C4C16|nr:RloB family protein [Brevibacterium sp. CCUG 69071]